MCLGDHHKLKNGYQNLTCRQDPLTANHLIMREVLLPGMNLDWAGIMFELCAFYYLAMS